MITLPQGFLPKLVEQIGPELAVGRIPLLNSEEANILEHVGLLDTKGTEMPSIWVPNRSKARAFMDSIKTPMHRTDFTNIIGSADKAEGADVLRDWITTCK
jgi:hypothetical protein